MKKVVGFSIFALLVLLAIGVITDSKIIAYILSAIVGVIGLTGLITFAIMLITDKE